MAISAIFSTFEFVHRNVPKNISDHFYYADMHGYYAGFDGLFLPHFYHSLYNSLIINEFNILHREVKSAYKQFTSITKPLYLFDSQQKTAKSIVGY